jgi:hypothetical protein
VNRIALHQSTVHPADPIELVGIAEAAGLDSVGLHVAAVDEAQQWWSRGVGSPMLHALIPALLRSRITVLDVGRVALGPELRVLDVLDDEHPYLRVLELGVRLGAQFVTTRAVPGHDVETRELFGRLAELADRYRLRPLITVVPGGPVRTLDQARTVIAGTGGGLVLDVSPRRHTATDVEQLVVELGRELGYVRVPATELATGGAPGLLATLPAEIPVAIGAATTSTATTSTAGDAGSAAPAGDVVSRVGALRAAVDAMLRHPSAAR